MNESDVFMKIYEVVIRLVLAILIGGAVGYERESKNRPAGFRTHILVCLGAAVISMIQEYTVSDTIRLIIANPQLSSALKADSGRLGAQVISGIGFLGAGTIIHEKGSVKGLTTAASIWVVACIGLAIGSGYYTLSVLSAISAVIVLVSLKKVERKFIDKASIIKIEIDSRDKTETVKELADYFQGKDIEIQNIEFHVEDDKGKASYVTSLYTLLVPKYLSTNQLLNSIGGRDSVMRVTIVEDE